MAETTDKPNRIDDIDRSLQHILKTSETPFLGLYNKILDQNIRKSYRIKLSQSNDPLRQYLVYLKAWPAISLVYLTLHVCEGFGAHGTFEVYPFIEDALQVKKPLTTPQKETLWKEYRKSCLGLGLSVSSRLSGTYFMVDEYLRQSGFPLLFVPDLTKKMIRYARAAGIPDDDDPASIQQWQDGLCLRLLPPFSRVARRALLSDDTGYYVRRFFQILQNPTDPVMAISDFDALMSDTICRHNQKNKAPVLLKKRHILQIPVIKWLDNVVGIEIPPGEGIVWQVVVDGRTSSHSGQQESRFVPFDETLPLFVEVAEGSGANIARKIVLWEDGRDNRLLIFSEAGYFIQSARLNAHAPLQLEPGPYQLVLRFIPNGLEDDIEVVCGHPALYTIPILLEPGQKRIFRRGPASIALLADARPLFIWNRKSIKGIRGNELYASKALKLKVVMPEEFFLTESHYFIRLSHTGDDDPLTVPLDNPIPSDGWIDIARIVETAWKPGVVRMLVELYRDDIHRPLLRASIMVWIGLKWVENRSIFHCMDLPGNLLKDESDNLLVDSAQSSLSYRNADNRYFRMVFGMGDTKRFVFTLSVPAIFLQITDYSASSEIQRIVT